MSISQWSVSFFIVLTGFSIAAAQSPDKQSFMLPKLYQGDGDGFIVIAHRGASASYPENTMAAFEGAMAQEAEMIELDVLLSKDGVPVVFHDRKLNVHTDGKGLLSYYTLDELKKLDAGSWFDQNFKGERIPTLEEVLAFASGKIALNIEIKTEAVSDEVVGGIEEKSLTLVRKYGMDDHVLFSSFDYRALQHLKVLAPGMPVALLYEKSQSEKLLPSKLIKKYKADAFNCSYRQLTKKRLANLKANEIPFFVYTVDQPMRMKELINNGATGIFTNRPDVLWQVIHDWNQDK